MLDYMLDILERKKDSKEKNAKCEKLQRIK